MQICVNAYTRNALSAIFAKRKQQRCALNSLSTHTGGTKTMRETLFVVCAQTFAPLAGGLKINYTHLLPWLRQTQRKRNPSERAAESEKKRPTFSPSSIVSPPVVR
jgi:hypothetical protein